MKNGLIKNIHNIWDKSSSKRKRIFSALIFLVISILITSLGMLVPLNQEEAELINNNLNQTVNSLRLEGGMVQFIFGNNFMICLFMFIPIIGPLLGFFALFNTGIAINAISIAESYPPVLVFVALFITPIAWIEYAAYSTAISESVWLFKRILEKRGRKEFRITCIFIALCAILLLLGAIVETAIILGI
jgi:hypothetical protein